MKGTIQQAWLISFTYTNSRIIKKEDFEYQDEELYKINEIELLEKETYFGKMILKQKTNNNKKKESKKLDIQLMVYFPPDADVSVYDLERYVAYFTNSCSHSFGPSFWHSKHIIENLEFKLTNHLELTKAGYSPPTIVKQRYSAYHTFSEENIDQFIQNMSFLESYYNKINYILNYNQLALDSDSALSSLVLLWMSFESLIRFASKKTKPISKLINQYVHSLEKFSIERIFDSLINPPCEEVVQTIGKKSYRRPLECLQFLLKYHSEDNVAHALIKMNLENRDGTGKYSKNLETHLQKSRPNKRKTISVMFQCFYAIRCKLVHGDKLFLTAFSERQAHPLRLFNQLTMGIIINDMFYKMIKGKKLVKCL